MIRVPVTPKGSTDPVMMDCGIVTLLGPPFRLGQGPQLPTEVVPGAPAGR